MKRAKWKRHLSDPDVAHWYDNVRRGSETTAVEQMRDATEIRLDVNDSSLRRGKWI